MLRNKAATRLMLYDPTFMRHVSSQIHRDKNVEWWLSEAWGGRWGVITQWVEFQFFKMKSPGAGWRQ